MKPFLLFAFITLSLFFPHSGFCKESQDRRARNECVILLHGLGRTEQSMAKIKTRLDKEGYQTVNYGYPSTEQNIQELADTHVSEAVNSCKKQSPDTIHFVTHSLGGILVRQYLQNHSLSNCGRVVMLSPPNKGSEIAEKLRDTFLYKFITGPAGQQLGTSENSVPNTLSPMDVEVGIITGNRSFDPWFSFMIEGDDDGKVSVEHARLEEMNDFLVVESAHAFIMRNPEVIDQIVFYLMNGKFKRMEKR